MPYMGTTASDAQACEVQIETRTRGFGLACTVARLTNPLPAIIGAPILRWAINRAAIEYRVHPGGPWQTLRVGDVE